MTDKELLSPKDDERMLLELAAKAAGITPINVTEDGVVYGESVMECDYWNPLTDDGDALRLAVELGLGIEISATRRAIVRAAAEIGEKL